MYLVESPTAGSPIILKTTAARRRLLLEVPLVIFLLMRNALIARIQSALSSIYFADLYLRSPCSGITIIVARQGSTAKLLDAPCQSPWQFGKNQGSKFRIEMWGPGPPGGIVSFLIDNGVCAISTGLLQMHRLAFCFLNRNS